MIKVLERMLKEMYKCKCGRVAYDECLCWWDIPKAHVAIHRNAGQNYCKRCDFYYPAPIPYFCRYCQSGLTEPPGQTTIHQRYGN